MTRNCLLAATLIVLGIASAVCRASDTVPVCTFAATPSSDMATLQLSVTMHCQGNINRVEFDPADRETIRDVRTLAGNPAAVTERGWLIQDGGLQYRVDLAERARASGRSRDTVVTSDTVMVMLDSWVGMPEPTTPADPLEIQANSRNDVFVLHAMAPAATNAPGHYRVQAGDLTFSGYTVFSKRPGAQFKIVGQGGTSAEITVHQASNDTTIGNAAIVDWVRYFANLSAAYWQGFPVDRLLVEVLTNGDADRVAFGRVRGGGGATLQVVIGRNVSAETLYRRDWILTHEMLHLAQPSVGRDGRWLMEEMATFIESILRHNAGLYSADQVWAEWLRGMPAGALALNTTGLVRGNPYWAGAVALLSANVAILQQSHGRMQMADCLRNGLRTIGNTTREAKTQALIEACDAATGGSALSQTAKSYTNPTPFNQQNLWQILGVSMAGDAVAYANSPRTRALREAILAAPTGFQAPTLPPGIDREK